MKDLLVLQAKRYGIFNCDANTLLREAARTMVGEDISGLVVVDEEGFLAGIFTRTDLLRAGLNLPDWQTRTVGEYMTREVVTVTPHDTLGTVADLLNQRQIHRVVIVHHEDGKLRPVGVISDADLVYHMTRDL